MGKAHLKLLHGDAISMLLDLTMQPELCRAMLNHLLSLCREGIPEVASLLLAKGPCVGSCHCQEVPAKPG